MYGWKVTNCESVINSDEITPEEGCIKKIGAISFVMKQNGRFKEDKVFQETKDYFVIIDGVVLNKAELLAEYEIDYIDILLNLYIKDKEALPKSLRGSFSGMIYDKKTEEIFAFTNHSGDGGVFYYCEGTKFIISSNFGWIAKELKKSNIEYKLDKNAVNYMCTFGYMLDNTTYIDSVKRIMPGEAVCISKGNMHKKYYHKFNNYDVVSMSEDQIIEELDRLFRRAIKREFDKDREYGYKSIIDLSGGLDCRVVNYVSKAMGYNDVLNVSFSQSFSDEHKAMMAISRDLKNQIIYYPLDNANHLYDLDKIVSKNYGLSFYAGAGAIMSIMENVNLNIYGLEHGGIMGDMAEGVFPGAGYTEHIAPTFEAGMPFSRSLDLNILPQEVLDEYENLELFTIMGRGLLAAGNTQLIRREYTGYSSPYEDVDFYDFFISIPLDIRGRGQILRKWIERKYPEAFDVIEDKLMCKPNANKATKTVKKFKKKVTGKITQYFQGIVPKLAMNNMNPMQFWYNTNEELRLFVKDYYENNIWKLDEYGYEQKTVKIMYESERVIDKLIALTVLSVIKQFF